MNCHAHLMMTDKKNVRQAKGDFNLRDNPKALCQQIVSKMIVP